MKDVNATNDNADQLLDGNNKTLSEDVNSTASVADQLLSADVNSVASVDGDSASVTDQLLNGDNQTLSDMNLTDSATVTGSSVTESSGDQMDSANNACAEVIISEMDDSPEADSTTCLQVQSSRTLFDHSGNTPHDSVVESLLPTEVLCPEFPKTKPSSNRGLKPLLIELPCTSQSPGVAKKDKKHKHKRLKCNGPVAVDLPIIKRFALNKANK